ncbi:hypothetical protein EVAR_21022_1 [Eumeta japonica]|uniref:Uncharacterized protein n=1 Tax=Eumeta variegata TaxID=151549 RepID=A0A4C1V0I0_EUMVA|nr:hypothetical protein EVAR_21022_1 [Eumeta japonica]
MLPTMIPVSVPLVIIVLVPLLISIPISSQMSFCLCSVHQSETTSKSKYLYKLQPMSRSDPFNQQTLELYRSKQRWLADLEPHCVTADKKAVEGSASAVGETIPSGVMLGAPVDDVHSCGSARAAGTRHTTKLLLLLPAAPPAWTLKPSTTCIDRSLLNRDPHIIPAFDFDPGSAFNSNYDPDLDFVSFKIIPHSSLSANRAPFFWAHIGNDPAPASSEPTSENISTLGVKNVIKRRKQSRPVADFANIQKDTNDILKPSVGDVHQSEKGILKNYTAENATSKCSAEKADDEIAECS